MSWNSPAWPINVPIARNPKIGDTLSRLKIGMMTLVAININNVSCFAPLKLDNRLVTDPATCSFASVSMFCNSRWKLKNCRIPCLCFFASDVACCLTTVFALCEFFALCEWPWEWLWEWLEVVVFDARPTMSSIIAFWWPFVEDTDISTCTFLSILLLSPPWAFCILLSFMEVVVCCWWLFVVPEATALLTFPIPIMKNNNVLNKPTFDWRNTPCTLIWKNSTKRVCDLEQQCGMKDRNLVRKRDMITLSTLLRTKELCNCWFRVRLSMSIGNEKDEGCMVACNRGILCRTCIEVVVRASLVDISELLTENIKTNTTMHNMIRCILPVIMSFPTMNTRENLWGFGPTTNCKIRTHQKLFNRRICGYVFFWDTDSNLPAAEFLDKKDLDGGQSKKKSAGKKNRLPGGPLNLLRDGDDWFR